MNFNISHTFNALQIIKKLIKLLTKQFKLKNLFKIWPLLIFILAVILTFGFSIYFTKIIVSNTEKVDLRNLETINIKISKFGFIPNHIILLPRQRYKLEITSDGLVRCDYLEIPDLDMYTRLNKEKNVVTVFFSLEGIYIVNCNPESIKLTLEVKN